MCQLILAGPLTPEMRGLRSGFMAACLLMGVAVSEMEAWREDAKSDREANAAYYRERCPGLNDLRGRAEDEFNRDENWTSDRDRFSDDGVAPDEDEPIVASPKIGRNVP